MAPEVDRQKARRQCAPNAWTASNRDGDRGTGDPDGGGKPRLGLPPHPGCTRQSGTRVGTWHDRQHSEASRHRTSPGAEPKDDLERVPKQALGTNRGQRLLHGGGVDRAGLQRFVVLFFIELSTRRVEVGGIARVANGLWMTQIARNLTDAVDGFFVGKRYLIHDRDPLYTRDFLNMLAEAGVQSVKLPPRSPNLNAYAERFVRTIKESCLERMIFFGETSLRKAIAEFVAHYHLERNHQGLGNRLIVPIEAAGETAETVQRRQRLGGMLNYYYREAA